MLKFKRILFPTDFSSAAAHALDYAISLALEHDAVIFLVHVIDEIGFNAPFTLSSYPTTLEYKHGVEEQVKVELQKVVSPQVKRQIQVEEIVLRGKPFVEIIRVAREKAVDLIVMPTHGHAGLTHSHLGSTTERVVRKSPCPVLVVRHPDYKFAMP